MAYVEELTEETCRRLLEGQEVGRIAFAGDDRYPVVLPVNYRVDADLIVFRTDAGLVLDGVSLRYVVFEVDQLDPVAKTGWSVLVRGFARDVTTALGEPYESLRRAPLAAWAPGPKEHWVAVQIQAISGRQIVIPGGGHG